MAVINRETIRFDGAPYERVIKVNSVGIFSIVLPPQLAEMAEKKEIHASSKELLLREWNKLVEDYALSKTKERKIIVYRFQFGVHIFRDGKMVMQRDDHRFTDGMSLSMEAGVYIEKSRTLQTRTTRTYEYCDSAIPKSVRTADHSINMSGIRYYQVIDWSQETEDYLARIALSLEKLAISIEEYFGNKDNLLATMKNGTIPLLRG